MTFRYSALNAAYFCPKSYELKYLKGIQEDVKSLDLAFGTAIHAGISSHFEGGDAIETFRMAWSNGELKVYSKSRFDHSELSNIGEVMLSKWVKNHAHRYKPLYVEQKLEFKVGIHAFTGTPDFIGYYDDKLSIVDWKTAAYSVDKRRVITDEQVYVYAHAAKQVYDLDIEQVVYSPLVKDGAKIQSPIVYSLTKEKLENVLANVESVALDLSNRTVFSKNPASCLKCGLFKHCYKESV